MRTLMTSDAFSIPAGPVELDAQLALPADAVGLVIFALGSDHRLDASHRQVARILREAGLGTLVFDMLADEERQRLSHDVHLAFDLALLAERLGSVTRWCQTRGPSLDLPLGFLGSDAGAGAALRVAASDGSSIRAVVSRGGRPDLVGPELRRVRAPTLLLVGELDPLGLDFNLDALGRMSGPHRVEVVPGASHAFAEPGALETVSRRAAAWFRAHMSPPWRHVPKEEDIRAAMATQVALPTA